ncbi:MAG: hypothetical protein AAGK21_18015 [Bacteroidota bacterium]
MTRRSLLLAVLCAAAVSGCQGDDTDADILDEDAVETSEDSPLFDRDFAQVCRGTAGQPAAAEYTPGAGVHSFVHLRSDGDAEFSGTMVGDFPDGWRLSFPDLADAALVLCVTRVSATPAELCEGYEDDDTGTTWTVQTHDAAYEYEVRVAQTAEVLGSQKFEVPAGNCPMFSMYSDSDPQPKPDYPMVGNGEVELFLQPFVTGG